MKLIINILFLTFILIAVNTFAVETLESKRITISGRIKDKKTGEELIGATVYVKELKTGTTTNVYGFYSLSLPAGAYNFVFSYVGYETIEKSIQLSQNTSFDIELGLKDLTIGEVVVSDKRTNQNVAKAEMSVVKLESKTIKNIPALMGEVDILKVIQLLPGVQSAGEGFSGYNVRGGSVDQNLILLDEATVYNASHLMGFFSVFNNDAIKDLQLYKGDIPAQYGGRLSSLLDVRMKDGNQKKFSGSGGIGTISSRLTLEGPLATEKVTYLISGRRSYADMFLPLSSDKDIRNSILYFYDLNAKINWTINDNNRLYLSSYTGRDNFGSKEFKMSYGNTTLTMRWNHLFTKKLFSNFSTVYSNYDYSLGATSGVQGFKWVANMKDYNAKADFNYYPNPDITMKFGFSSTYHQFQPGIAKGVGDSSIFSEYKMYGSNALQHGIFFSNEHKINALLTINYGVRYSIFQSLGASTVYTFDRRNPDKYIVTDTTEYGWGKLGLGEVFKTYSGFEPRLGIKFSLTEVSSIKGSYSRTRQYIHLASNSTGSSPLDIWLPSSPNVKPQICDQWAIGYFRNFLNNMIEASAEVYYKKMDNQIDFKDHAELLLNKQIEGEFRIGKASSYGLELYVRKQEGKLNGWISYTYSKTERKIPEINDGKAYPASYDKPHNISVVLTYDFTKRISLSANWVFASGNPVTMPTNRMEYGNMIAPVYVERNAYRMPDYHRLDLALNVKCKEKPNQKFWSEWNFSVYNAYYRKNTWMISFEPKKDANGNNTNEIQAYKTFLFPILPSVTYNFHF